MKAIRLEFEDYNFTPSLYIKQQVHLSDALFVLLGSNVQFSEYTENWIAFEVGLAAGLGGKDIWVFEPSNVNVRFPVPFLHHYVLYNLNDDHSRRYISHIVKAYETIPLFRSLPHGVQDVTCGYDDCRQIFRLHTRVQQFNCPTCRRVLVKV